MKMNSEGRVTLNLKIKVDSSKVLMVGKDKRATIENVKVCEWGKAGTRSEI